MKPKSPDKKWKKFQRVMHLALPCHPQMELSWLDQPELHIAAALCHHPQNWSTHQIGQTLFPHLPRLLLYFAFLSSSNSVLFTITNFKNKKQSIQYSKTGNNLCGQVNSEINIFTNEIQFLGERNSYVGRNHNLAIKNYSNNNIKKKKKRRI